MLEYLVKFGHILFLETSVKINCRVRQSGSKVIPFRNLITGVAITIRYIETD